MAACKMWGKSGSVKCREFGAGEKCRIRCTVQSVRQRSTPVFPILPMPVAGMLCGRDDRGILRRFVHVW